MSAIQVPQPDVLATSRSRPKYQQVKHDGLCITQTGFTSCWCVRSCCWNNYIASCTCSRCDCPSTRFYRPGGYKMRGQG